MPNARFSIDTKNRLYYWLNPTGAWLRRGNPADKVIVEGLWHLDPNNDLRLELRGTRKNIAQDISDLKGEIICAEGDSLVFELKCIDRQGLSHIQILKLTGIWQVDGSNRLVFKIGKTDSPDTLTFEGTWLVNQNQQLSYVYQKTRLKKKDKSSAVLTFSGFWQISAKDRLRYIISESAESKFDFQVQLESPNLHPRQGVIKYRLGAGFKSPRRGRAQIIALYGTWKLSRALGVTFEMEYSKGAIRPIQFGAEANFKRNNEIIFQLNDPQGRDVGINLTFTHKFLQRLDARVFLKLKAMRREHSADVGVKIPF